MKHLYKAYNLHRQDELRCENICAEISNMVREISNDSKNNRWMLVISIRKIHEYDGDSPLPKIKYEPNSPT